MTSSQSLLQAQLVVTDHPKQDFFRLPDKFLVEFFHSITGFGAFLLSVKLVQGVPQMPLDTL